MALESLITTLTAPYTSFFSPRSASGFHFLRPSPISRLDERRFFFQCRSSLVEEQQGMVSFSEPETSLLDALIGIQGRGRSASPQQLNEVERAVSVLEASEGVSNPTTSGLIEGRWQLMFTTRPETASPIQRTFVGVDFFSVFQEIDLQTNDPRVSNIVKFSDAIGELKVEAGYTSVGKKYVLLYKQRDEHHVLPAAATIKDGKRILFRFDRAAFSFKFLPFKVPYPVPFRLLGDEAKGWLDTTYLSPSGNLRVSRGSKGTTFVLIKQSESRQKLLSAISTDTRVEEAIDEFILKNQSGSSGERELQEGEWKMIWSSQTETDSWIENAANGLMGEQIVKNGQIKFQAPMLPGLRFSIIGSYSKTGPNTYEIKMDDAAIIGGPFGYPLEIEKKFNLQIIYSDDRIRITRGYNNIMFVHLRTGGSKQT